MVAKAIQRDESAARNVLERLVEAGLAEAHSVKKGRTYTLSPRLYHEAGEPAAYVRQAGFDPIRQEQMVIRYVKEHGQITRSDTMGLCQLSEDQATRHLDRLVTSGQLVRHGAGRGVYYTLPV